MNNSRYFILSFTFVISIFSLVLVSCKQNQNEQFVKEVCNANVSNIDSVFLVYKNLTKVYKENVLLKKSPSAYFVNSFEDLNNNYLFVGFCKTFFCKNYKRYAHEKSSARFMEFLVLSKTKSRKARFIFKKTDTWILHDIVFE
jgi:hypothetical protein